MPFVKGLQLVRLSLSSAYSCHKLRVLVSLVLSSISGIYGAAWLSLNTIYTLARCQKLASYAVNCSRSELTTSDNFDSMAASEVSETSMSSRTRGSLSYEGHGSPTLDFLGGDP
eukprot:COSAG02_NODE_259_length_26776_cov_1723.750084_12_plen_114_part_00